MTGRTSAALIYRNARVTGLANSTFASNSEISFLINGMFTGRVITWIRFVRTSAAILILPTTIESSERAVSAPRSPSTETCAGGCGTGTLFGGRMGRTPGATVVVVVVVVLPF